MAAADAQVSTDQDHRVVQPTMEVMFIADLPEMDQLHPEHPTHAHA